MGLRPNHLEDKIMAFDKNYFSSVNNQQCAGERIQTWQYETVDPVEDLTAGGYFAPVRQSIKVNDRIWVIQMDPTRTVAQSRYDLTVRVNEGPAGPNAVAVVAVPDLADATTTVLTFEDLSTAQTLALPVTATPTTVVGAYAVLLGSLESAASLALAVKSSDGTPKTVYSGTLAGPADYGTELTLAAGTADTDLAYSVTITPTSVPAGTVGTLQVFIQTKVA
jgi:hypothetical protein